MKTMPRAGSRTPKKDFLTIREAAKLIGKHYGTVRIWVLDGRIPSTQKTVNNRTFYRVSTKDAMKAKAKLASGIWL